MPLAALGMALLTSRRLHLQRHRRAVGPAVHSMTSPPTPLAKLPLMQPSTRRSSLHAQPERAAQPGLRIARHRRPSAPRSAADWPHSSRRCCGRCGAGSRCAPQRAEHARRRGRLLCPRRLGPRPTPRPPTMEPRRYNVHPQAPRARRCAAPHMQTRAAQTPLMPPEPMKRPHHTLRGGRRRGRRRGHRRGRWAHPRLRQRSIGLRTDRRRPRPP